MKKQRSARDYQKEIRSLKEEVRQALDSLASAQTICEQQDATIVKLQAEYQASEDFGRLFRVAFEGVAREAQAYFEALDDNASRATEAATEDKQNEHRSGIEQAEDRGRVIAYIEAHQNGRPIREIIKAAQDTIKRAQARWKERLDGDGASVPGDGRKGQGRGPKGPGSGPASKRGEAIGDFLAAFGKDSITPLIFGIAPYIDTDSIGNARANPRGPEAPTQK